MENIRKIQFKLSGMKAAVSERKSTRDMVMLTIRVWVICPGDKLNTAGVKNSELGGMHGNRTDRRTAWGDNNF